MPVIFNGEEAAYDTLEDVERVTSSLLSLYNLINDQVRAGDPQLPPGCVLHRDPLDNLEEEAPLSDWSWGFAEGHRWLSKIWEEAPDDIVDEYAAILMILYFFTSRPMAERICKESKRQDMTLEEMAAGIMEQLGEAMRGYAALGMALDYFGDVDRPLSFYEEKFLTAFLMTLREISEREYMSREDTVRRCFTVRAMEHFVHFFGFMEYAEERPKQLLWEERVVRKTPFLDDWISFRLDQC